MLPFSVRRPFLILRDLIASRERPDLDALRAIDDPEQFVWAILPHAARTFAVCIALLPGRAALASAVAYLYCRMLDTYEDLVPDREAREAALRAFAARFDERTMAAERAPLPPAPPIASANDRDDRDRAHLLLVSRAGLVDQVFLSLDEPTRHAVRELVHDMAEGMRWSSAAFAANDGVLPDAAHLARYCRHVLGNPVVFSVRLLRLRYGSRTDLTPAEREDAMLVGEMVQLANVTRDIEKDLRRGVAYDALLRHDLGRDVRRERDPALEARVRDVRRRLVLMALTLAPAYRRVVASIPLPRTSVARASAVVMFLFTERHFRHDAMRAGLPAWDGPDSVLAVLMRSWPATFSAARAEAEMQRIEAAFRGLAGSQQPSAGELHANADVNRRDTERERLPAHVAKAG